MWTRAELKSRGKESIKRNYWIVVLVALVAGIINGQLTGNASYRGMKNEIENAGWDGGTMDLLTRRRCWGYLWFSLWVLH